MRETPLKGLVLGWYHQGNTGDDRFAQCLKLLLPEHDLIFLPHTSHPPSELIKQSDFVILGGGSIANAREGCFRDMAQWIEPAGIPVFAMGIGISEVDGLKDEFDVLLESGGVIWVRDRQSLEILGGGTDRVLLGPDLTFINPLPIRRPLPRDYQSDIVLNIRPWPKLAWQPTELVASLQTLELPITPLPLCFHPNHSDFALLKNLGLNPPDDFDFSSFHFARALLTMRYHGMIFSVQTNTPFIALDNSKKNRYFLDENNLNDLLLGETHPETVTMALQSAQTLHSDGKLLEVRQELVDSAMQLATIFREEILLRGNQARVSKKKPWRKLLDFVRNPAPASTQG